MKMKPLSLNDNMLIPSNALKSKIVLSPAEIEKFTDNYYKLKKKEEEIKKQWEDYIENEEASDNFVISQQSWCLSCWTQVDLDRMYEISYRMIIEDHK